MNRGWRNGNCQVKLRKQSEMVTVPRGRNGDGPMKLAGTDYKLMVFRRALLVRRNRSERSHFSRIRLEIRSKFEGEQGFKMLSKFGRLDLNST